MTRYNRKLRAVNTIRLTIALFIALLLSCWTTPAFAFTPPSQGTANATDVVLWHGDNATVNMPDLTTAAEAGAQVIADALIDFLDGLIAFLLVIAITAFALIKGDPQRAPFPYLLAVPVNLVFGLIYASVKVPASSEWVEGVIVAIIGTYLLVRVATSQFDKLRKRRR